jgi:hypothetical protein
MTATSAARPAIAVTAALSYLWARRLYRRPMQAK